MCQECKQYPCHPRCPNAPGPSPLFKCEDCNDGIIAGEEYVSIDGKYYHFECLESRCTKELIELLGCEVKEAGF